MPFIPLPSGIRIAMEYTLEGEVVVNIFHVTHAGPIATANLTAIAGIFKAWFQNDLAPEVSNELSLSRIVVTDVSVANGIQEVYTTGLPLAGSAAAAPLPNNVAVGISFFTGFSGRSFRGRSFLPGIPSTIVADNRISSVYAGVYAGIYAELINALNAADYDFVVASYQANLAPRVTGVATPVATIGVNTRVDTQRRRLPRA